MKEIERIINDWHEGKLLNLAKAIEQYVIEARIKGLEEIQARELALADYKNRDYIIRLEEEIAELKKGLK